VSICALWSDGKTAQIDAVSTLAQHRRRGHAAAVVAAALHAAEPDHGLIFLVAEEDTHAARWYARAGFEPVGVRCEAFRVAGATRA
jgi:ribosomal protein S18 acetylase RimI-like enzyme